MYVHADGTLRASAFKPIFGNGTDFAGPTRIQYKARSGGGAGFSYAFDWIGSFADWDAGGGELGASETGVLGKLHAFFRAMESSSAAYNPGSGFDLGDNSSTDWHIVDVEWIPGTSITIRVDGIQVWMTTTKVWTTPKRWLMQSGGSATTVGSSGWIDIDWTCVWTKP
jgi:hypothetical protein